jgi:hypothetical protein
MRTSNMICDISPINLDHGSLSRRKKQSDSHETRPLQGARKTGLRGLLTNITKQLQGVPDTRSTDSTALAIL